ncbi:MAG: carboxypeptidase-like regulatory domain-containing protein [Nevskiales bacterium]
MKLLRSRFVLVPAAIGVAVLLWNVYVSLHAHGVVVGRVVDAAGRPAAGATVVLFERDFVNQNEHARATTDTNGNFRFDNNRSHLVQLEAQSGAAHSPRVTLRLWFRAQDRALPEPLRLGAAG